MEQFHATTVVCVRRDGRVAIGGDGQVSLGDIIIKHNARKVRRLFKGAVVAGFAGGTADAFTLFDRFESKLVEYRGNLTKAAVELAKDWRTDRTLRRLEALLIVADKEISFLITGMGDVLEPEGDVLAIGSGGEYARSAASALMQHTTLSATEVVLASLQIAADICIYTNGNFTVEELTPDGEPDLGAPTDPGAGPEAGAGQILKAAPHTIPSSGGPKPK